jgi:hypothetical protein
MYVPYSHTSLEVRRVGELERRPRAISAGKDVCIGCLEILIHMNAPTIVPLHPDLDRKAEKRNII